MPPFTKQERRHKDTAPPLKARSEAAVTAWCDSRRCLPAFRPVARTLRRISIRRKKFFLGLVQDQGAQFLKPL